ncbi:MAG: hypothetical protein NC347_00810 [Clostridium sp.]|nr:hypothetical protein [Clostridium sp.]
MIILALIFGIISGVCIAVCIVIKRVKRSNDIGDNAASFYDFSQEPIRFIWMKDRI